MAQPAHLVYSVTSGQVIRAGRLFSGELSGGVVASDAAAAGTGESTDPLDFADVTNYSSDAFVPTSTANQPLMLYLHGSGTNPLQFGAFWRATMLNNLAYPAGSDETMYWAAQRRTAASITYAELRPRDRHPDNADGAANLNSYHMGWTDSSTTPRQMHLITERRMDELLRWAEVQYPQCSTTKRYMSGDSVGAWATITFGLKRPDTFAAIYPNRPRVRWSSVGAPNIVLPHWPSSAVTYNTVTDTVPNRSAIDGGGSMLDHMDAIAYVSNPLNRVPWVGWVIGKNDGYMPWQDHVDFIAALRAARRGFAVAWNLGNHSAGPSIGQITGSYYIGLFEVGVGYPLYTNNSGDADPVVDDVGGINLGFQHRNVVESASGWSCEVTNTLGARQVDVEPLSPTFTASVTPQTITIPAAGTWVPVSFTA